MRVFLIITLMLTANWIPIQRVHTQKAVLKNNLGYRSVGSSANPAVEKRDTISIYSKGVNNKIVVNSIELKESINELELSSVKGEITQQGQNNSVEINAEDEILDNKKQIKNNKDRRTGNKKPATIKITQTGKNNSVKINSH